MYSSLHWSDFLAQHKDGTIFIVLTDHRTPLEVEAEGDISTAFAIIRIFNAIRMVREQEAPFKVLYSAKYQPPEFLHQEIASAGGILSIDQNEIAYPGNPPDILSLMNGSFSNLAHTVARRQGSPLTLDGLKDVERKYFETGPNLEEDEIT